MFNIFKKKVVTPEIPKTGVHPVHRKPIRVHNYVDQSWGHAMTSFEKLHGGYVIRFMGFCRNQNMKVGDDLLFKDVESGNLARYRVFTLKCESDPRDMVSGTAAFVIGRTEKQVSDDNRMVKARVWFYEEGAMV